MAKNLLFMFVAGLLVAIAVHVTEPVHDWWSMSGRLVGVAVGAMVFPALIAAIGVGLRKFDRRPIAGFFFTPLWGVWAVFAFFYVFNAVVDLRADLARCVQ